MAPDASFSLFPRVDTTSGAKAHHTRKTSSKSLSSPVSTMLSRDDKDTAAALSVIISNGFKTSGEFDRPLAPVPEERSAEQSPVTPSVYSERSPSTFIGPTAPLNSNPARRARTPSPPRIQTDFSNPLPRAASPPKAKKLQPSLRTSQLSVHPYSLPLSPPPSEELPALPAHVQARRKSVSAGQAASPASTQSPASNISPSSAKAPSSATTISPRSPEQTKRMVSSHKNESNSISTMASTTSPQASATTSPQFAFSPSLIKASKTPVAYPSIPPSQSPPVATRKPSKEKQRQAGAQPQSPSYTIPPPPSGPPPQRPRRPSDSGSTFSGSTALTYARPPHQDKPSRSIFPTFDPSVPLEVQQKSYGPRQQLQYGGFYAPSSSVPKHLRHSPSSPDISSSRTQLTSKVLAEHEQFFEPPPFRVGTAPTTSRTAPRAPAAVAPSVAISNRPPLARANSSMSHYTPPTLSRPEHPRDDDPALVSKSWGALTFMVGVGVEVVGGAVGGLKTGIQKERAKRERKREKKEKKSAKVGSRWDGAGEDKGYARRIIEVEAKVRDVKGEEVRREKMDFRI